MLLRAKELEKSKKAFLVVLRESCTLKTLHSIYKTYSPYSFFISSSSGVTRTQKIRSCLQETQEYQKVSLEPAEQARI